MTLHQEGPKVEIRDDRGHVVGAIYPTTTGIMVNSDRLADRAGRRVDPIELQTGDPGVVYLNLDHK